MAVDRAKPGRGFVTAAQSLQHLATNARLGNAKQEASAPEDASTKVYQQAPRADDGQGDGERTPSSALRSAARPAV